MPKSEMKPEIFLWLNMGIKPKEIVKMGYGYTMVYNYNRRLNDAKKRMAYITMGKATMQREAD